MKIYTFIIYCSLLLISCAIQQNAIDAITSSTQRKFKNNFKEELKTIVDLANNKYHVNLYNSENLFLIHGTDVTTRDIEGRIWNKEITIFYNYNQIDGFKINGKLDTLSYQPVSPTEIFSPLIQAIESNDFQKITDYASTNEILSGWGWVIATTRKTLNGKFENKRIYLNDFYRIE